MSNTPNTDTLEDQAREYFKTDSGPFTKDVADFARQVAKEAVRQREAEIAASLGNLIDRDVRQKAGSE